MRTGTFPYLVKEKVDRRDDREGSVRIFPGDLLTGPFRRDFSIVDLTRDFLILLHRCPLDPLSRVYLLPGPPSYRLSSPTLSRRHTRPTTRLVQPGTVDPPTWTGNKRYSTIGEQPPDPYRLRHTGPVSTTTESGPFTILYLHEIL